VQLVGFIIRIYHDARSSECQPHFLTLSNCFLNLTFKWYLRKNYSKCRRENDYTEIILTLDTDWRVLFLACPCQCNRYGLHIYRTVTLPTTHIGCSRGDHENCSPLLTCHCFNLWSGTARGYKLPLLLYARMVLPLCHLAHVLWTNFALLFFNFPSSVPVYAATGHWVMPRARLQCSY